jgi:rhamnosyltransferase
LLSNGPIREQSYIVDIGASASGPLRVAIIGTRGLPPAYGGYETVADYFVRHFVGKGHEVIVACEKPSSGDLPEFYRGAKLDYFPTKPPKRYSLRKIYEGLNDLFFYFRLARKCDVMYILAGLGTQVLPLVKLLNPRLKIVTNNDGIEWKREKYSWFEKKMWKSFIRSSLRFSDLIIYDNPRLAENFPKHNLKKAITIEYGVEDPHRVGWNTSKLSASLNKEQASSLSKDAYYVVVARLQKDNNTHKIIEGYQKSGSALPLVIIGDSLDDSYQDSLESLLRPECQDRILFTGGIYDLEILNMLRQNSFSYLHGHSAGGTNPGLLEAMVMGSAVIAHNNPFNENVLDGNGLFFSNSNELSELIIQLEGNDEMRKNFSSNNRSRALGHYTWKRCMELHERSFRILLNRRKRTKL